MRQLSLLDNAEDNLAVLDHHTIRRNGIGRFGIGRAMIFIPREESPWRELLAASTAVSVDNGRYWKSAVSLGTPIEYVDLAPIQKESCRGTSGFHIECFGQYHDPLIACGEMI